MRKRLRVDLTGEDGAPDPSWERVTLADLRRLDPRAPLALAKLLLGAKREAVSLRLVGRASVMRDLLLAGVGLLARAREVSVEYAHEGEREKLSRTDALLSLLRAAREAWLAPSVRRRARARARRLLLESGRTRPKTPPFREGPSLLLRTDMDAWAAAGGSIAHLSGILGALQESGLPPTLVTAVRPKNLELGVPWLVLPHSPVFSASREQRLLSYDETLLPWLRRRVANERPSLLYERYGPGSLAGALVAREAGLPHVLEYNGSETWVARKWGEGPLLYEEIFAAIERAALLSADIVSVVSRPLEREAIARGVSPERVVLAPNGVEPERFREERLVSGRDTLRKSLGFESDHVVLGFVSSFGPWHGAEVLADAFSLLDDAAKDELRARALDLDDGARRVLPRLRLLLVGDGVRLGATLKRLDRALARGTARSVGLVPQREAPRYLAASDILCSPHVPNPDGTAFFGSPTKVFEYMASARPIVASDLDQVGEVLRPALTRDGLAKNQGEPSARALLVPPGDARELARALALLASRPETGEALGRAAREAVLSEFTWQKTLGRVLSRAHALAR